MVKKKLKKLNTEANMDLGEILSMTTNKTGPLKQCKFIKIRAFIQKLCGYAFKK